MRTQSSSLLRHCYRYRRSKKLIARYESSSAPEVVPSPINEGIRLSKHISSTISISRKRAERLIQEGRVTMAGQVIKSSALLLNPRDLDSLSLNGKKLGTASPNEHKKQQIEAQHVWLVHKLRGELVTASDPNGRATIFDRLRRYLPKNAVTVGRLDLNTEGLLLVTTDGQYSRSLELPSSHYHRVYRVRVHGRLDSHKLTAIRKGAVRDTESGMSYGPMRVDIETKKKTESTNQWLKITCTEGKNRQIRRVLQNLGLAVTRLIRVSFGDYQLTTVTKSKMPAVKVPVIAQHRRKGRIANRKKSKEKSKEAIKPQVQWMKAGR